jgi:tRNA/rRNA methyltransferase
MPEKINLDNVSIVLYRPRYAENIGSAARAMRNMGIGRLAVVAPENDDLEKMLRLATHAAADTVKGITRYDDLESALFDSTYVVGTTARTGAQRQAVHTPAKAAKQLIPISENNRIAILFGPEDRGLENEAIRLCHMLVTIPTAAFSSINLAQAVMIVCYEIFQAADESRDRHIPRLANRFELEGMYAQLQDVLVRIDYILEQNPEYWMNKLRHFFSRLPLRAHEVSIIRGICRQIDWYGKKCYLDGRKGRTPDPALGKHGQHRAGEKKKFSHPPHSE